MEAAIAWLVSQLCSDAQRWGWAKAKDVVLGSPLERGLERVSSRAMSVAVAATLGVDASAEAVRRMESILNEIWPQIVPPESNAELLRAAGLETTLLDRVRLFVERAMRVAGTPVVDLSREYRATSSLASLAFDLGVHIDENVFVDAFVATWSIEVRARRDPAVEPVADRLEHETTRDVVRLSAAAVTRQLEQAVQVLSEQRATGGLPTRAQRWFEFHIVPTDAAMTEIYDDYRDGFRAAASGLQTRASLEELIPRLHSLRERALTSRINAKALGRALEQYADDEPISTEVLAYAVAVQAFFHGATADETMQSWYSYYIEWFSRLLEFGVDPLEISRYTAAELPGDVPGALRRTLSVVADQALPRQFEEYKTAYYALRLACTVPGAG